MARDYGSHIGFCSRSVGDLSRASSRSPPPSACESMLRANGCLYSSVLPPSYLGFCSRRPHCWVRWCLPSGLAFTCLSSEECSSDSDCGCEPGLKDLPDQQNRGLPLI